MKSVRLEDCERDCVNVLVDGFHQIYNFLNIFFDGYPNSVC